VSATDADKSDTSAADRNGALEVVAKVLEELAGYTPAWWEFREILGTIGRAIGVDRVYVLQNGFDPKTGALVASQRAEWCADGISVETDNPRFQNVPYESFGQRWLEELSSGRPLHAKASDFTEQEHAFADPRGTQSLLVVPLTIGGTWWGAIGFDQCSHEREWDSVTVRLLTVTGTLIANQLECLKLQMNLEGAEKRSRLAMSFTGAGVWDCDLETRDMFIASELKDAIGFADEEIPNRLESWIAKMHPDDRDPVRQAVEDFVSGAEKSFEIEHRMITKAGSHRWFSARGSAIRDAKGKVIRLIGTSTDITDRKQSETAFRAIFEGSPEGMMLVDVENDQGVWTILDCNGHAARMHGYERREMLGRPLHGLLVDPFDAASARAMAARIREEGVIRGEAIHSRKDGSTFWCGFQHTILNIDGRDRLLVIEQDITEKQRLEDERLRASKLEALGLLAGGIAHDFNNVLTAIIGNLSLVRMDLPADTPVNEFLDAMEHAGARARELAAQLLTFARGGMPVLRVTSLADAVKSIAHLSTRGSHCKVVVEVATDVPQVEADEGQISQVLQGLLINADQAMPEGGIINVALDRFEEEDLFGPCKVVFLRLRISDTGQGIPQEIRERIFDPYFTTKAQGSGLGLATAYSIIRQHRGSITVKSEVGLGTEFTILLPAATQSPAAGAAQEHAKLEGNGRILVMDDEDVIRTLARRGLGRYGYDVVVVRDGEEAIAAYEEAARDHVPFDAVVLDMVIPGGLGGEKTIERLRAIDPEVRGLAMSGYSKSGVIGNPTAFGFKGGLAKPFTLEQLAKAIGCMIGR